MSDLFYSIRTSSLEHQITSRGKLCQSVQLQDSQFNALVTISNHADSRNLFHFLGDIFKIGTLGTCF